MEADPQKRSRSQVFSEAEDATLIESYFKNRQFLEGKFSSDMTTKVRNDAWDAVTAAVNAAV